jgi:2-oxoglutarate dehydrogenase E1 component
MLEPTPLYGGNADFLEGLYEQYLRDPASVDARWRGYFERMAPPAAGERSHSQIQADIAERARAPKALAAAAAPTSAMQPSRRRSPG